jgi:D-alanine--poly(phosphoribitol) ligase subunit 1
VTAPPTDVLARILDQADRQPDHPAAEDNARRLSYVELITEVTALARGLDRLGVRPGDRVALHLPNSVDFVSASLACAWVGAVFVPLAVSDPDARRAAIVASCEPALILGPTAGEAESDGQGPSEDPTTTDARWRSMVDVVRAGDDGAETPAPLLGGSTGAYSIYTSGTTGTPKGVLIGRSAFAAAVANTATLLGMDSTTRALCVSPFHFDGSFGTLFPALVSGGSLVIPPRESLLFPQRFFRAVTRGSITHTGFSPSYLRLLLASPGLAGLADTELRTVALGGEASSPADILALWAAAPRVRIFNRYGPTETTIAVTHLELTRELVSRGTPMPIGRPHPGVTFHLVDDDGVVVDGVGRAGELYIGGDQLMSGYLGDPALTADVLRDDVVPGHTVYRTGDVVMRDERGDYIYLDRKDRVVKRSGVRISLLEVAGALREVIGVRDATAVTYDDGGNLAIAAFVVAKETVTVVDLRRSLGGHLPSTMLPDVIRMVDVLPMTSSGKVDDRRLLADAALSSGHER